MTIEAKKKVKLLRKIPPKVIQEALGLAIYTNFVSLCAEMSLHGDCRTLTRAFLI